MVGTRRAFCLQRQHDREDDPCKSTAGPARPSLTASAPAILDSRRVQNRYVSSSTGGHARRSSKPVNRLISRGNVPARTRPFLTRLSLVMKGSPVRVRASASSFKPFSARCASPQTQCVKRCVKSTMVGPSGERPSAVCETPDTPKTAWIAPRKSPVRARLAPSLVEAWRLFRGARRAPGGQRCGQQ